MGRTNSTRGLSQLIILITTIVAIAFLYFARVVFVPFALAVLFAFLLTPIVTLLDRIHIPRAVSSLVVVAIFVIALGWLGWIVTGQLVEVAGQLPAYRSNIKQKMEFLHGSKNQSINKAADAVHEIGKELVTPGSAPGTSTTGRGNLTGGISYAKPIPVEVVPPASNPLESLNGFVSPVGTLGIVIVFTLFMLIRREDLRNRFIRLVGHGHLNLMTQALDDTSSRVSRYLFLQLSVNVGYGVIVGAGLYLIGVPHALLWGAMAAVLRFLPYVGPLLSAVLPCLLALAMFDGWTRPLMTVALYGIVELIVGNVVEPLLYGANVGLSSLAILVAAVFWTILWGPIGLVLSTPLTVCLVVMGRYVPNLGFLNILLGDEPVLRPESHFYQRLLASDQQEAKRVLESYLRDNSLLKLYDSVLIPALALAEQDRHRNDLDEATQQFITLSTKEFVEELGDRTNQEATQGLRDVSDGNRAEDATAPRAPQAPRDIVCVPARDDADEIIGTMLAQVLEQAGHRAQCVALGTVAEMMASIAEAKPEILCISALPPFAVSHARSLYKRLLAHSPALTIFTGLWGFSGDLTRMGVRMHLVKGDRVFGSLDQMISEIAALGRIGTVSNREAELGSPAVVHSSVVQT